MATKSRLLSRLIEGDGNIKTTQLDSDVIGTSAAKSITAASGTTIYSSADTLPVSANAGDQAFVSSTNRLYIFNGSGWYNIALINSTPYWITEADGSYTLSTTGAVTTITMLAQDSDGINVVYTATTDSDFDNIATISKDSDNGRTFTITPIDSEGSDVANGGTGTVTFKASDGVNLVSTLSTFIISFKILNSNYTTLLLKADTTGTDNQVDTSSSPHAITEVGAVTSTAFSPYHPGGYSTYFDGTGDYLTLQDYTNLELTNSDFTIELWIKSNSSTQYATLVSRSDASFASGMWTLMVNHTNATAGDIAWYMADYSNSTPLVLTTGVNVTDDAWHHIALVRNGSTFTIYVDGVSRGTGTSSATIADRAAGISIGRDQFYTRYYIGYIRDIRIVNGTAVYTSAFTSPTEPLTAIANTSLLACSLPYFADGSTNSHTITVAGNTSTKRFGPYDYLSYEKADYGGSVWYGGAGNSTYVAASSDFNMPGDFTWEAWIYPTTAQTNGTILSIWASISNGYGFWYTTDWTSGNFGSLTMYYGNYGSNESATSVRDLKITLNAWHHVAISRSGSSLKMFINGKEGTRSNYGANGLSWSDTRNFNNSSYNIYTNGSPGGGYDGANMYVSDARMTVGTAWYTADFTPPTEPLTATNSNVQFLSYTNKNDIWDESSGNLLTKGGNATSSNTQRKFTTSSAMYFDGGGDSILVNNGDEIADFKSDDFTIEFWLYMVDTGVNTAIGWRSAGGAASTNWVIMYVDGLRFSVSDGSSYVVLNLGDAVLSSGQWYHTAVTRNGNTFTMWIDGSSVGTATSSSAIASTSRPLYIGYDPDTNANAMNGYIQDVRITKGLARYTSNFTPPTAEFDG